MKIWNIQKMVAGVALCTGLFFLTNTASAQSPCDGELCVVQFNASWNASNDVDWMGGLGDCTSSTIVIDKGDYQSKYEIVVVPTIIVFYEGEEIARFQADISFSIKAKQEDVQEVIDEIIMNSF